MSLASELIAQLRSAISTIDQANSTAAAVRDQADALIAELTITTDGTSDPCPAEANGEKVYFDAVRTRSKDGKTVEVFIDAKGKYDQFIDRNNLRKFQDWWEGSKTSGLRAMMENVQRQIIAAGSGEVEWWCAEPKSARVFNRAMQRDAVLKGKAHAIHKPRPGHEQ